MRKVRVYYKQGAALLWVVLGMALIPDQDLLAEQMNNPESPPLQVVASLLSTTNVAWDAGTTGHGGIGVKVKTLKWQVYQDHGRHE
jgi:hypothetical protein